MIGPVFAFRTVVIINFLTEPVNDAGFVDIVGGHLQFNAVANGQANKTFAHFSGNMREHVMFVRERNAKHGAGKDGGNYSFNLDRFFGIHHNARPGEPTLELNERRLHDQIIYRFLPAKERLAP